MGIAALVVADGSTQAKDHQVTAFQKDSENTETKLKGALALSPKMKTKEVEKTELKATAKAKSKESAAARKQQAEKPKPVKRYPGLDAKSAKYVGDCDRRIVLYNEMAVKARDAGDEDLAQLYLAAAAKEQKKKDAVLKPEPSKEDTLAVQEATKKESAAFNRIVKRTDKKELDAEQKQYIRTSVVAPLQASNVFYEGFIKSALQPLLQQYLGSPTAIINTAQTIHSIASGGCATTGSAVSTGIAVASFVIPLIRSLIDLVQFYMDDNKQTITNLNYLVN